MAVAMKRGLSGTAIVAFALVAPFITWLLWHSWGPASLVVLFVSHVLLLYPTLSPSSQWWGKVVTCFDTPRREVWLTIDDGPDELDTPKILDVLDRFDAKATFFIIGKHLALAPNVAKEVIRRGHQLGNHTHTHPSGIFWCATPEKVEREIDLCAAELGKIDPQVTPFFRTPAGLKNPFVHPCLRQRGLTLIGWTTRGFDTISRDPSTVVTRIMKQVGPGAIILLHEGHSGSEQPDFNVKCLTMVLEGLSERGYACVIPALDQLQPNCEKQTSDC